MKQIIITGFAFLAVGLLAGGVYGKVGLDKPLDMKKVPVQNISDTTKLQFQAAYTVLDPKKPTEKTVFSEQYVTRFSDEKNVCYVFINTGISCLPIK